MFSVYLLAQMLPFEAVNTGITDIVLWIRLFMEAISVIIIVIGVVVTIYSALKSVIRPSRDVYTRARFVFTRYLILGLEFQLAADIIGTAVSPSWDQLGKLAVIAAIRTFLSFFLQFEIKEEKPAIKNRPAREETKTE